MCWQVRHRCISPERRCPQRRCQTTSGAGAWIAAANWIVTLGFAVAAMLWLWRYVGAWRAGRSAAAGPLTELGLLSQAFAAAGTALMFAVMG
ncbi:DUF5134 domain-containing protein [Mycobacterium kansasii]|uniref:DUF5134 domain-containing protein n=1 Tax=Mycobacterium ostraviense TaxID=2738409 RepID=UPI0009E1EFBF|nr:DUF5134 domain-containing protein [Mycobacterium ostraviense]